MIMDGTIFFGSISWAIQAQKLLEKQGITSDMRKVSNIGPDGGCGYGLDLHGDLHSALQILESADIKYIGVE